MESKYKVIALSELDEGRRLDGLLRRFLSQAPISLIYKAIRKGDVRLNTLKVSPHTVTSAGDILEIYRPLLLYQGDQKSCKTPSVGHETLNVKIIFENKDFLIVNKDRGMLVVPRRGMTCVTLKDWILSYKSEVYRGSLSFRPAPLHRLDRNTTGLLVFSLSLKGAREFSLALKNHEIEKTYLALVEGKSPNTFDWSNYLIYDRKQRKAILSREKGKLALTKGRTLGYQEGISLVEIKIGTGLTHQIRACATINGFPLLGDKKYGSSFGHTGHGSYYLHAHTLVFPPYWAMAKRQFVASLPCAWKKVLSNGILKDILEKYL